MKIGDKVKISCVGMRPDLRVGIIVGWVKQRYSGIIYPKILRNNTKNPIAINEKFLTILLDNENAT